TSRWFTAGVVADGAVGCRRGAQGEHERRKRGVRSCPPEQLSGPPGFVVRGLQQRQINARRHSRVWATGLGAGASTTSPRESGSNPLRPVGGSATTIANWGQAEDLQDLVDHHAGDRSTVWPDRLRIWARGTYLFQQGEVLVERWG